MEVVIRAEQTAKHKPHKLQPITAANNPDAQLRIPTAAELLGRGVSTVYKLAQSDPTFPKLIKNGKRCTRIRAGDLTAWLQAQVQGK